jgi:hypothetical protein
MTPNRIKKVITNVISLSVTQWAMLFLFIFFSAFFCYFYVAAYWGISPLWGLILGSGMGLLAFLLVVSIQNWLGRVSFNFHMGRTARWSLQEQLEGDLNIIRNYKLNEKYNEALHHVNKIIDQHPEFADAFLLKSQIVWEGFQNRQAALKNISKVMELVPDKNAELHRWALSLYKEVRENGSSPKELG